jgi:protein-disulfide isomerase
MTLGRLVFVCLVTAMPSLVAAQSSDLTDLKREIEALRATQLTMQTDLQEIKAILQRPTQAAQPSGPVANAIVSLRDVMIKGNVTARVALVEFADYECPFCGRYATQSFPEVEREYIDTGKIRYAFIDFPLESIHPQSVKAAEAALCAGDQGKYWDMHDRLMRNQSALSPSALPTHAAAIGLDQARFADCLSGAQHLATVRKHQDLGRAVGVRATPTIFIGRLDPQNTFKAEQLISGAQPFALFKAAIDWTLGASGEIAKD